jgi:hypothetical protein
MRSLFCVLLFACWSLAAFTGCGGGKTTVSGSVSFDGKPVEDGSLMFTPKDGKQPPTAAAVKGGQYSVELAPGSYKVAAYWPKTAPGKGGSNPYEESGDLIPEKYNRKSDLTLDVSGGSVKKDWDLKK